MELTKRQEVGLKQLESHLKSYEKDPSLEEGRHLLNWLFVLTQAEPELFDE